MTLIKYTVVFALIGLISACSAPRYTGTAIPSTFIDNKPEVIIIEDAKTKKGFLKTVEKWLGNNGYKYVVKQDGSEPDAQKLTIQYSGRWKWDLALFLNKADIEAYYNNEQVALVNYKAPNNGHMNKFSKAETRIEYMLEVLFGKLSAIEATKAIIPKY